MRDQDSGWSKRTQISTNRPWDAWSDPRLSPGSLIWWNSLCLLNASYLCCYFKVSYINISYYIVFSGICWFKISKANQNRFLLSKIPILDYLRYGKLTNWYQLPIIFQGTCFFFLCLCHSLESKYVSVVNPITYHLITNGWDWYPSQMVVMEWHWVPHMIPHSSS